MKRFWNHTYYYICIFNYTIKCFVIIICPAQSFTQWSVSNYFFSFL